MTAPLDPQPAPTGALALDTYDLTKRFGSFTAMDRVTMSVAPGSVHALLGENGAGKSTLVKCVAGSQRPDGGSVLIDGREHDIATPIVARALGIGMVYQHFTLAPGMSVAENLLLAGGRTPALIDWKKERAALREFLRSTPFTLDLDATPAGLSAGEKQKLELLKQLYLKPRLLILDEPTSVLTPQEADEVLAYVRAVAQRGECTVLMITHKFREVMAYADEVTVLRRGRKVHGAKVAETTPAQLRADDDRRVGGRRRGERRRTRGAARADAGECTGRARRRQPERDGRPRHARGARASLTVRAGEILGIAGVSGNGQREMVEAIVGQRARAGGSVHVAGAPYAGPAQREPRAAAARLTEEPLRSASVGELSVSHNMALRDFDQEPLQSGPLPGLTWLRYGAWRERARAGSPNTASRRAARTRRSRACRAATCSARCWRASWPARSRC